jgi:hypothetical protein
MKEKIDKYNHLSWNMRFMLVSSEMQSSVNNTLPR